MKISYVTPADQTMASVRYRILIPASQLKHHEIYVDSEPEQGAEIAVFSKHWATNIPQAKAFSGTVIYDICDDHFEDEYRLEYKSMCRVADVITCNSEAMANRIREVTGKEAIVIPDPYEMPFRDAEFSPGDVPKLLWFGHGSNLPVLQSTPLVGEIEIVTNCKEAKQAGPVTWTPYSPQSLLQAMQRADMVVIPQDKPCKSANRVIESLRQGKFVLASPIPAYQEFAGAIWLCQKPEDFTDGILWALNHPADVKRMIQAGQEYIELFNPKAIAEKWDEVFRIHAIRRLSA